MNLIGITERGDPVFDHAWLPWVQDNKPAILITKDPDKLFDILEHTPNSKQFNIIIHTTITGLGQSIYECEVPHSNESLKGFEKLCDYYGPERIVLRIDPIIPTDIGTKLAEQVLEKAQKIVKTRVRISFIDQYDHVKERFDQLKIRLPWSTFHAPLELRKKIWEDFGKPEVCGEPGFECTGCVSKIDCEILGVKFIDFAKGQREHCACLASKKELLTQKIRCTHKCLYCYWQG